MNQKVPNFGTNKVVPLIAVESEFDSEQDASE